MIASAALAALSGGIVAIVIDWSVYQSLSIALATVVSYSREHGYRRLAFGDTVGQFRSATLMIVGCTAGLTIAMRLPLMLLFCYAIFVALHIFLYVLWWRRA